MAANAKLPVIAWNCHPPEMKTSRAIASLCQGSRPSTKGAVARIALSMPAVSAAVQLSPQPTRPLSARSLTITSLTPSRSTIELSSRCR